MSFLLDVFRRIRRIGKVTCDCFYDECMLICDASIKADIYRRSASRRIGDSGITFVEERILFVKDEGNLAIFLTGGDRGEFDAVVGFAPCPGALDGYHRYKNVEVPTELVLKALQVVRAKEELNNCSEEIKKILEMV